MPKCECEGAGYEDLSDQDLKMLFNIMKRQNNDVARGTLFAVKKEQARRKYMEEDDGED